MAIANPLVLTFDSESKSLVKINQDNFGSEYYLREATQEFRCKIRSSTESPQKNGQVFDRHNVDITHTVFSSTVGVPDTVRQIYVVLRNVRSDVPADVSAAGLMMTGFLTDQHLQDLVAWVN
jgi:hypothetical protein